MASLDHRLNPLFSIKECSSCGALYTADFCCSKGGLEDKILVPKPPQNCATCGDPVDGLYCRPCAFVRKCLNEGWYTIHDKNEILNTSESSNHNTNVVSAPQEPFVFNQDPGKNSSQSPPQINHNCCYECGDSLDDIFCQRCTCKSCGNGAHIGYNCPPKAPIISNPEQCNQTIDELPQTLPSVHPTCNSGDENSFTYDSKPNSVDDSPNVFNPPPQPSMYSCEFCGNDARYGHYSEERFLKIKQVMREEQNQPEVMQELLLKLIDDLQILKGSQQEKKETAAQDVCTFLRKFSRIPFGVTPKVILIAWERFGEIKDALTDKQYRQEDIQELMSKLLEDVRNISEELSEYINCPSWNRPTFYDNDDDEYTIIYSKPKAITPDLSIEEPDNSLNMGDEHLDTIPSIENLVPIPKPPDVEISLIIEPNATVINNFDELNEDECFDPGGEEIDVEDDDSFTFVIQTFLPFLTYPRIKPNFSEDSRVRWQQSGRSEGSRVSSQTLTSKHMDWFTAVSIGVPVRNALWFLQESKAGHLAARFRLTRRKSLQLDDLAFKLHYSKCEA
ncbi:hypothetical protein Tco_1530588 [Tanacetum coccineum]